MHLPRGTRVYIAGPMTGYPEHNFPAFHEAAKRLRAAGFIVNNPADLPTEQGKNWGHYMRRDIPLLLECQAVAVLDAWYLSPGARLECHIAAALSMPVLPVETFLSSAARELEQSLQSN